MVVSFDDLLDKYIGFGKYQLMTILALGIAYFVNGAEYKRFLEYLLKFIHFTENEKSHILMNLMNPALKQEWKASDTDINSLTSIFYVGKFIGTFLLGVYSDLYGRKRPL